MFNNNVCHNTVYNLSYTSQNNITVPDVCWCDGDSASIANGIYDGYDNVSYGLFNFIPMANCNNSVLPVITASCPNQLIGIDELTIPDDSFILYPNPTTNYFLIKDIFLNKNVLIQIINILGETVYTEMLSGRNDSLIEANLTHGIYFVRVSDEVRNIIRKLIVE